MSKPHIALSAHELAASRDLFLLNPENREFIAGKSSLIKPPAKGRSGIFAVVLISACVLILVGLSFKAPLLFFAGVKTQGVVVDKWIQGEGEDASHYITLRFSPLGQRLIYQRNVVIKSNAYDKLRIESPIEVTYLPSDTTLLMTPFDNSDIALLLFLGSLGLFLPLQFFWLHKYRRIRQRRIFAQDGKLLRGEIVGCEAKMLDDEDGTWQLILYYRFYNPAGKLIEGVKKVDYKKGAGWSKPPVAHDPIAILYIDDTAHEVL